MKKLTCMLVAFAGIMAMILIGCTAGPSRLEADYGTSYNLAKSQQMLNPAAEKNLEPVYGFNGRAAEATIARYREMFEKPPPAPTYVIPVGQIK
jgi:hypothetical protein